MKPQRAQRNTLCPQKKQIRKQRLGRRKTDSLAENERLFLR